MPRITAPLSLYVLHAADSSGERGPGEAIADGLFRWFRRLDGDALAQVVGLPVHRRVGAPGGLFSPPIAWDEADLNVVVVVVDAVAVLDAEFRAAVAALDLSDPSLRVVPVLRSAGASRALPALAALQGVGAGPAEGLVLRVQRGVTELLVRALGEGGPPKVFVSHAKHDGRAQADRLRSEIPRYGQYDAFFDEHDLAFGQRWAERLDAAVGKGSAGLVVLETDTYASRPWCRREVAAAREPRRVAKDAGVWTSTPTVVASAAGAGWSRVLPELANVPRVAYREDVASDVLDRLGVEIVLAGAWRRFAMKLGRLDRGDVILTFTPDPWTLARLLRERREVKRVVYPGHGLSEVDRKALVNWLPREVTLRTYAEHLRAPVEPWDDHPLVGLSLGDSADLAALGYLRAHVDETARNLVRGMLQRGARVSYGGSVVYRNSFNTVLLDVVRAYAASSDAAHAPMLSWTSWPYDRGVTQDVEADLYGVLQVRRFDHDGEVNGLRPLRADDDMIDELARGDRIRAARALRRMREAMADGAPGARERARVLVGGKLDSFSGYLPGLAEELVEAWERGVPVVLANKYGGWAGRAVDALTDEASFRSLGWGAWAREPWFLGEMEAQEEAAARYGELQETLTALRALRWVDEDGLRVGWDGEQVRAVVAAGHRDDTIADAVARVLSPPTGSR